MRKTSEAKMKANAKYDATHTKMICLKLNLGTDADILERLAEVPAMQTYIKELIREDIGRKKVGH